jgi:hypothetical protein
MIALRDEFLLVAQEGGQFIPCSVEHLTFELAGEAAKQIDPEWMRQAAAGVLHYFKEELGKSHVTVTEFTAALSKVFQGLGLTAEAIPVDPTRRSGGETSGPSRSNRGNWANWPSRRHC